MLLVLILVLLLVGGGGYWYGPWRGPGDPNAPARGGPNLLVIILIVLLLLGVAGGPLGWY